MHLRNALSAVIQSKLNSRTYKHSIILFVICNNIISVLIRKDKIMSNNENNFK